MMNSHLTDDLVSKSTAAHILYVSRTALYDWISEESIKVYEGGKVSLVEIRKRMEESDRALRWINGRADERIIESAIGELIGVKTRQVVRRLFSLGMPKGDGAVEWYRAYRRDMRAKMSVAQKAAKPRTSWVHIASEMSGLDINTVRRRANREGGPKSPVCFWLWNLARGKRLELIREQREEENKIARSKKKREMYYSDQDRRAKKLARDAAYRSRPEVKRRREELAKKYREAGLYRKWEASSRKRPEARIKRAMRRAMQRAVDAQGTDRQFTTIESIGCTPVFLAKHLESQFRPGMTWDNYGKRWQIDHIYPLSRFDLTDPRQQLLANHWKNLRPLWNYQNQAKRNHITDPQLALRLIAA